MRPGPRYLRVQIVRIRTVVNAPAHKPRQNCRFYTERLSSHLDLDFLIRVFLQQPRDCSQHFPLLDLSPLRQALKETRAQGQTFIRTSLADTCARKLMDECTSRRRKGS